MMPRYRAKADLQLGSRRIREGETFGSDMTPGRNFHPLDEAAEAAVIARFGEVLPDRPQRFNVGGTDSLWPVPRVRY
jgi:hypothetical protein